MPVFLGPFDQLKLNLNIINKLLQKNLISPGKAKDILRDSMDEKMSKEEKEKILGEMVRDKN